MSSLVSPPKPEARISRNFTLPVELWWTIFREATAIPAKNEFGTDPRAYNNMLCDPPVRSSRVTAEELRVALSSRLQIVLVCKYWRDIGLPILYSHFRIMVIPGDTKYQTMHQTLAADARLTNYVRRVTVIADGAFREAADNAEAKKQLKLNRGVVSILSLFEHLKIMSASTMLFWSMPLYARSNILIADFRMREINHENKNFNPNGWDNLIHLALNFSVSETLEFQQGRITLPLLTSLDIRTGPKTHHGLIDAISIKWYAPKLHTFGLYSQEWTRWRPFFDRHASTLTILNIQSVPKDLMEQPPVRLPSLQEFYLELEVAKYEPGSLVTTPQLERMVVHQSRSRIPPNAVISSNLVMRAQLLSLGYTLEVWARALPMKSYGVSVERSFFDSLMEKPALLAGIDNLRRRGSKMTFFSEGTLHVFEPIGA